MNNKKRNVYILVSLLNILFMSAVYFIGTKRIGYGIFHIYSIFCVVGGFIGYDLIIKTLANKYKK